MSRNISISRLRDARNVSRVDKIITNNPTNDSESSGSTTWVPENEAYNYVNADTLDVSENGTYRPEEDGNYYNVVKVEVEGGESSGDSAELIEEKTIKANGTYYALDDAQNSDSMTAAYEQVNVQVPLAAKVITVNGQYDATDDTSAEGDPVQGFSSVEVKVSGSGDGKRINKTIKDNGLYKAEDEEAGDDEEPIIGYSQVDVALPMVKKKVNKNGTFNASDEQDANGDTALAYSEVEVGVEILQPRFSFVIGIDRKKRSFMSLPFELTIRDTKQSEYSDYEKYNPPAVSFKNARIFLIGNSGYKEGVSFGNGQNVLAISNTSHPLNLGWPNFFRPYGVKPYTDVSSIAQSAMKYNVLNSGRVRTIDIDKGVQKFIYYGTFTKDGNSFDLDGYQGAMVWRIKGVSFQPNKAYSFAVVVKAASV